MNTATSDVSNDILYLCSDANVRELRIHVHVHTMPSMKYVIHTAIHRCTCVYVLMSSLMHVHVRCTCNCLFVLCWLCCSLLLHVHVHVHVVFFNSYVHIAFFDRQDLCILGTL